MARQGAELALYWEAREPSQADDGRRFAQFVNGLPEFDSIFQIWLESPWTKKKIVPVPLSEDQAKLLLARNISRFENGDLWLEQVSNMWGGHVGPPPYDFRRSSYADTRCTIGAFGLSPFKHPNNIFMRLSEIHPSDNRPWRASQLTDLMKFARNVWAPAEMRLMFTSEITDLPMIADPTWAAGERVLEPRIGWITYLPPDLAARAKYPGDVEVETLDDGAALVTLCEEMFDRSDVEGVARMHALEAALRPIQS